MYTYTIRYHDIHGKYEVWFADEDVCNCTIAYLKSVGYTVDELYIEEV